MDKDTIFFQYYAPGVLTNKPKGSISLEAFLRFTADPPQEFKEIFSQISAAEIAGQKEVKARLKQNNLYYFTPCVQVGQYRRYECIKRFTGLLVLDFDHIDHARDFKYFLFGEYYSIIAAWLSPSKRGVKCIVKIPIVETVAEFKEFFYGIAAEMDVYSGFDSSGQNAVLPLFQSYDDDLLSRSDFSTWTVKGYKPSDFDLASVKPLLKIDASTEEKQTIIKIINTGFCNIIDYGHPPLRDLCIVIGGYIAAGYLDEYEALQIINHKIENHKYLRKGIEGYKKTARWAIMIGQNKPLTLNNRRNG